MPVVVVVVVVYFESRNCPTLDALLRQIPFVTIVVYSMGSLFEGFVRFGYYY
jgi:hypothetical protein